MPVAVLGSINADLVVDVVRLPRRGETVAGSDLRRLPGGKGANQAVAARRIGAGVSLVGAVGDDDVGAELLRGLAGEGVGVDAVTVVAVALADGLDLAGSVRRGCAAGALATLTSGAQAAMPSAAQVDASLRTADDA